MRHSLSHAGLHPGDIILISAPTKSGPIQKLIKTIQLVRAIGAASHNQTTHAAICISIDSATLEPIIAHLTGGKIMGYTQEPLSSYLAHDNEFRKLQLFRPEDPTFRQRLIDYANGTLKPVTNIKWSKRAAAKLIVKSGQLKAERRPSLKSEYSERSFCSKFVIEALKFAATDLEDKHLRLNIRSDSCPKSLEAELKTRSPSQYKHYVCLGPDPVEALVNSINTIAGNVMVEGLTSLTTTPPLFSEMFVSVLSFEKFFKLV